MDNRERHRDAEARMREVLAEAGLPEPDEVSYEGRSVYLRWVERRLVVAIDLDDPRPGVTAAREDAA